MLLLSRFRVKLAVWTLFVGALLAQSVLLVPSARGDEVVHEAAEVTAKRLESVRVPQGFEVTVFATPPTVNYPVAVATSPDGDVYVSIDKNSSLDRKPGRGSVIRLRDVDGDGRADEKTVFVADVDSPRGLVWDHDRLYLMHPPHLSAFIDDDGDGIADRQERLVSNIAFGFEDRPADHTSNGITLGIDGWLYLAIGDFGFMRAEGSDGRTLQLRGGGVVRVRPDGSEMELYSRGTRNILEVSLDPLLNGFARDNTNDGGGWDIRLHHFSGLENHGYPTLFTHFTDEVVAPLADYGGGSGCGGLYLSEPGFPADYGNALYTADWGREIVYRHLLTPNGATFAADQSEFLRLPRVTDLDVDAMSRVVAASWQGGMYNYGGENVGFLVQIRPQGYQPDELPNFASLDDRALCELLRSPSHRRRLEAQRTLLRRGFPEEVVPALTSIASDTQLPLASRTAAVFALKQARGAASHPRLATLAEDPALRRVAIRAMTDRASQIERIPIHAILQGLVDDNAQTRCESVIAIAKLQHTEQAAELVPLLDDDDALIRHTTVQALTLLGAADLCLAVWDSPERTAVAQQHALRVLQSLHQPSVVDALSERLKRETDSQRQRLLFAALCRLHDREGEWRGNSWGTRPDTRGPYYQPEPWSASPAIAAALASFLQSAPSEETAVLAELLQRHRMNLDGVVSKLMAAAERDASLMPALITHLAGQESPAPAAAVKLLQGYLQAELRDAEPGDAEAQVEAASLLLKSSNASAFADVLAWLGRQTTEPPRRRGGGPLRRLRDSFFVPQTLDSHFPALQSSAMSDGELGNSWADAALAFLAYSEDASPENRAISQRWADRLWQSPPGRIRLLRAFQLANVRAAEARIRAAWEDSDSDTSQLAEQIARRWNLPRVPAASGPLIKTLERDKVIAEVANEQGDASYGEAVFNRLACNKCHTVRDDEPLRGPYLPNVVKTFPRQQLAEAILIPGKSIAQGFVTNVFILTDGRTMTGFVTREADDAVTIRDGEGKESVIAANEIEERVRQETVSLMPEGLANELTTYEFASLLDYLQSLAP